MLIKIEYNSLLSYVTYINKVPIIQTLSLTNDSDINLEGVKISIKWGNKVVEDWQQDNIKLEANQTIKLNFEKQPLRINAKEFVTTTESYPEVFTVIVEHDGSIISEQNYDITVLAYNQWLGSNYHPTLITSFITPNHPQVIRIIKNASDILKKWDTVFSAYQTQDKTDVRKQIKAIYLAIQNEQINYVSSAPSFEDFGQRVRLADDVLAGKMGNCIELAILFASCLEHARLNPIIVFLYGHAFVGCWLEDQTFQNSVDDDVASLSKRLASGVQTIELIESTLLANSSTVAYEQAVQKACDEIVYGKKFDYLLDVSKARSLGIRPLPQKIELVSINDEQVENNHLNTDNLEHLAPKSIVNTENIEVTTSSKRSKIQVWESKLLNMTLKNSLLNFRPTRRSISILEGDLNLLEDNLSSGSEFSLVPCPQEIESEKRNEKEYSFTRNLKDEYREYMNAEMKSKRIVSLLNEEDLDYAIKALYYTSRTDLEENGANTLFVAMGFLKWYESDVSKLARYAPILLYPIEMIRKSSARGYVIRFRDEEVQINTTLLEKLRVELNMEFPGLNPLPMDEKGIDVRKILNTVRTAIMDKRGWDIIDVSYIALFSFNQFVMWNDIHSRNQELMENKIVSSLLEGKPSLDFPSILETKELDKSDMFLNNAVLMDADSSQLAAIYSATNGSSFVLHGPPGTGKSQTITNIIASALYNGKSVLFVAEKMAALNVVQSRLENIGIGDFALELHSNKTKKTEVLQKIDRILSKTRNGSIKQIDEKREELQKLRDKISETTNNLHRVRDNGYSIYEMISLYESQGDNEVYPVDNLAKDVNKKLVEQAIEMLDRYVIMYGSVAPIAENPLNFIKITNLTLKDRDLFKENIENLKKVLVELENYISKQSIISIPKEASFSAIKTLADMLNVSVTSNELVWDYLEKWNQEDIDPAINQIILKGFEKQKIKQTIEKDFDLAILGFDAKTNLLAWNASLQSWFLPKFLEQNKILKAMRVYAINQKSLDKNKIKDVLESLCKYKSLDNEINQFMNIHGMKLGQLWTGEMTDWTRVKEAVEATDRIINLLRNISKLSDWFNITSFIDNLKNEWASFKLKNKDEVLQLLEHCKNVSKVKDELELFAKGEVLPVDKTPADMISKLCTVLASYSNIDKWVSYVKARADLEDMSLTSFVSKVVNGEISIESLKSIALKSLMYYGILELLEDDIILTEFNSRSFEFLLSQYKQELSIVREMTRLELIEKLVENIPKPQRDVNENSELGIMMKAIKSNGRGLSLRKLFDMTPNVLRRIAPCMLMSPISIAQYIDPSFPKFDLVVFDEASQVYTHSAVGAIARGNQLIVVGDPNQLPPTAFFSGDFDDEDYDFDERDQDSILTECQSIMFPQLYLRWHYRSSHESLISFSNTQYYENKLFTFPSYNDLESKVKLVQVGGFYDRGGTKQNIAEAEAIIEEVLRRLKSPILRKKSIGIVTFSSVQQKLIQTKLDDTMARYPQLEEYANELEEAIFVKNLENVQGDERDVILFSVGYGPDQNGKVTMNFGPLNQDGGWKRLNVVVSRSRDEMIVFSTLRPEQIDLSKTSAEGVYGLKRFLEFARNKDALIVNQQNAELVKDDMIEAIANELVKQGYSILKNVGKSNFRIDIGVVNPKISNEFIAAIVIDGVQYSNTPTVRDKVIVQPSMLSRLKWSVIRVWTLEWFKNKQNVLTEIKNKLDELINKNSEELLTLEKNEENEELESQKLNDEKNTKIEGFRESKEFKIEYIKPEEKEKIYYKAYNVEDSIYPKESFYEFASISKMAKLMNEIIQYEAPIVEEDLFRRVMSAWGISTLGTKVKEILKDAANRTKSFLILDDDKNTYWRSEEEYENGVVCRAYKDDKRKFNYIPDEEIIATIIEVLKDQISLNPSNLCKEVFKVHGYTSLGQEAQNTVLACAEYLVNEGKLVDEDGRYVLG